MLAAQLVAFFIVGVYRGVWRHFGMMDGVTVAKGVLLGTVLRAARHPVLYRLRLQLFADGVRHLRGAAARADDRVARVVPADGRVRAAAALRAARAVIYGAGENAGIAVRELQTDHKHSVKILGFIDDDPKIARLRVAGYPVLGDYGALELLASTGSIDTVILSRHLLDASRRASLESLCAHHGIALLRLNVGVEELVPINPIASRVESPRDRLG